MSRIVSSNQLEVCEEVGKGGFGVVYRGIIIASGQEVAIKQIDLEHESADFVDVNREIQILSECQSPQITQYYGCFVKGYKLWVIMEYADGGSLFELLKAGAIADDETILVIAHEILLALDYLHRSGKIHRDLKSQNILLNQKGNVKVTDFGVSTQLHSNFSRRNTTVGTPYWMAPEVIMNDIGGHSYKADIWSLGCCVYELRSGKPPLQERFSPLQALRKISSCKTDEDFLALIELNKKSDWPETLKHFLKCCFRISTSERSTATELLKHKFITRINNLNEGMRTKKIRELITRKRLWDQENHVQKSQKYYAPTEIANNQNKWRTEGINPVHTEEEIHFDISTIKDLAGDSRSPEKSIRSFSSRKTEGSTFPIESFPAGGSETSRASKAMRAEFSKLLNKSFAKMEQKASLSTGQYDSLVLLNETLLGLFVPTHVSDSSGMQTKILACQYIKYFLKEATRPGSSVKSQLQRAIVPSSMTSPFVPESTKETSAATAIDEIEWSLLESWLNKTEK